MTLFDALPRELREFLASYPRGIPAAVALNTLKVVEEDVREAIDVIRSNYPVSVAA